MKKPESIQLERYNFRISNVIPMATTERTIEYTQQEMRMNLNVSLQKSNRHKRDETVVICGVNQWVAAHYLSLLFK